MAGTILILAFASLMIAAVCVMVLRISNAWNGHRIRMQFMKAMERGHGDLDPIKAIYAVSSNTNQQDFRITGILLLLFGIASLLLGRWSGNAQISIGLDMGGVFLTVLGIMITLFGILVWAMEKTPDKQ